MPSSDARLPPRTAADGVLLVYDVGNRKAFERAFSYWAAEVIRHGREHVPVLLVGAKADLAAERAGYRVVPTEEGAARAAEASMLFCETSAATGASVIDAFSLITCEVHSAQAEEPFPELHHMRTPRAHTPLAHGTCAWPRTGPQPSQRGRSSKPNVRRPSWPHPRCQGRVCLLIRWANTAEASMRAEPRQDASVDRTIAAA